MGMNAAYLAVDDAALETTESGGVPMTHFVEGLTGQF